MTHKAEFRESIRPAIPQIITLLSDSDSDVRKVGTNVLSYLSEQGEYPIAWSERC